MNSIPLKTSIQISIYKHEDGIGYFKDVTIAPCPFCNGVELIVSDVELCDGHPQKPSHQVVCGSCGNAGPWAKKEEGAVQIWNVGLGFHTNYASPWVACPADSGISASDVPF